MTEAAAPSETSACVRRPAGFPASWRFRPTAAPTAVANASRKASSIVVAGGDAPVIDHTAYGNKLSWSAHAIVCGQALPVYHLPPGDCHEPKTRPSRRPPHRRIGRRARPVVAARRAENGFDGRDHRV